MTRILCVAILCCAPLLAGPAKAPAAVHAQARPNDAEIEQAIRAKLANSKIAAERFTVQVHGGVATFEGRTDILQHKGVATRFAKSCGARAVVNNIVISEAARRKVLANLQKGREAAAKRVKVLR